MRMHALVPAAVLVLLSPACGTLPPPRVTNLYCSITGPCIVPIHVDNCAIFAPSVSVPAAVTVYWTIDDRSTGYRFPDESLGMPGVWIDGDNRDNPQFVNGALVTRTQFQLSDRYVSQSSYRYGIQVVKGDGTPCPAVTASISNRGFY